MSARPESDGGLHYLEQKLGIFIQGTPQTRRNAALDILTGRVADERNPPASPGKPKPAPSSPPTPGPVAPVPPTRLYPSPAYRGARVFRAPGDVSSGIEWNARLSTSPWLAASDTARPRFRLAHPAPPPPARWPGVRRWFLLGAVGASLVVVTGLGVRSFVVDGWGPLDAAPSSAVRAEPALEAAVAVQPEVSIPEPAPAVAVAAAPPGPLASTPVSSQPVAASASGVLLDQRFTSSASGWPNDPHGPGWFAAGTYRLAPSYVSHFVALGIPGAQALGDASVTGSFRKVGGPGGGGYGLIVRNRDPEALDGFTQSGRYYVFEVGDAGEAGIWLRDGDQWIDVQVWTPSNAVHQGLATNELTVAAIGDELSFVVNGVTVARHADTVLHRGDAGVFVGGDRNEVALDRITVTSGH